MSVEMEEYLESTFELNDPAVVSSMDESSLWAARFGLLLLEEVELRKGMRVLDLGCGTGFPAIEIAQMLGRDGRVVAVDIWAQAIQRAKQKLRFHGMRNVRLVVADGVRLPVGEGAFDLVVSNLGVNNFADPPAVAAECVRVLRRGGRMALTTNTRGHMAEFYEIYRHTLRASGMERYLARLEANEAHRGTPESVMAMLRNAGFRIRRTIERSFVMRYLDGTALMWHTLTRIGFLEAWRKLVDPADVRTVFAALEMALNERARREGELRFTVPILFVEAERP